MLIFGFFQYLVGMMLNLSTNLTSWRPLGLIELICFHWAIKRIALAHALSKFWFNALGVIFNSYISPLSTHYLTKRSPKCGVIERHMWQITCCTFHFNLYIWSIFCQHLTPPSVQNYLQNCGVLRSERWAPSGPKINILIPWPLFLQNLDSTSQETSKPHITGICEWDPPLTGIISQRSRYTDSIFMSW